MEIPAEIHNYALVVSYKTRKRCKHFHPNVSKPLWCFWWINRSVISFSWSLHLSRVTTKRFIKGWKIFLPSLRNIYQSIHSNSFCHCWAKPTSTSKLAAARNVFRASFQCFLGSSPNAVHNPVPASLHIKELIRIIAPLRPFIIFSSSTELCQHDAAAHGTVRHRLSTKDNVDDSLKEAPQSRSDCGIQWLQHLTRHH